MRTKPPLSSNPHTIRTLLLPFSPVGDGNAAGVDIDIDIDMDIDIDIDI